MQPGRAAFVTALLAVGLLASCQYVTDPSPDPSPELPTASPTSSSTLATPEATGETSEPTPSDTTEAPPTPPSEDEMPGEPVEGFPEVGTGLVIIGVPAQEILNLRIGPGIEFASIGRLTPDTSLVATGRNRDLGSAGVWYQVRAGDDVGWVFSAFVAEPGAIRDVTDHFDPPPSAKRPGDLVDEVVAAWQSDGHGEAVVVYGPVVVDDLQFRVDVPSGDESVVGARLFVVAAKDDDTFTVTRVTATQLCAHGVLATGDCR